jgi:L-malate glycosyltransferase
MKILVFADRLDVGGTQVNAIDLTEALRDLHGHEVVLFATPGPMVKLAHEKGLRFLPAPYSRIHPSPARMRALREAVQSERPDVIHIWDWPQCLDAYYGVYLTMRVPMIVTVMTMDLPRLLPKALPTTLGTPQLLDQAKKAGRGPLELILPPVDVNQNTPGAVDTSSFREQYGIRPGDLTLVTVSRLVEWMKAESLRRTIEVVGTLGRDLPLRFLIVGDGTSRAYLDQLAQRVNSELGRQAVVLTGALLDPRPAYAAADIVIGMGSSALRGMAFAKPVIVVGERGFSAPFNSETSEDFYYTGFYGVGEGKAGNERLATDVLTVASQRERFGELGQFSRDFVITHFSVEAVGTRLERFCRKVAAEVPRLDLALADGVRTAAVVLSRRLVPDVLRNRLRAQKRLAG